MNLTNRLSKLEAATAGGVTVMWRHHTETDDQAIARWHVEHPGERPEELKVIIVEWSDPQPDGRPVEGIEVTYITEDAPAPIKAGGTMKMARRQLGRPEMLLA